MPRRASLASGRVVQCVGESRYFDDARVEGNVVFTYLDAFDDKPDELDGLKAHYRRGGLGDMVLKRRLNDRLQAVLGPIRTRRAKFAEQPDFVMEMVRAGAERAATLTKGTLDQVRSALGLFSFGGG